MSETLYGTWSIRVLSKDADFDERFTIAGSAASDGSYPGTPGTAVTVSGTRGVLTMEWNDRAGSGWQPSATRRSAAFTVEGGLVLTLGADDNTPAARDFDYNDMVLECRYLDPALNPLTPAVNPYDFSVPKVVPAPPPCEPPPCEPPPCDPPPVESDPPPVECDPPAPPSPPPFG